MAVESAPVDRVVGPLREQRLPLYDGLRQLQQAAAAIGVAENVIALAALDAAVSYLSGTFVPTSKAEQFTLFIAVDGVIGAVGATHVMVAQHRSIEAMVKDLAKVVDAARTDGDVAAYVRYLQPLLFGLYALIRGHLEAEDDAYLGVLDEHLSESQVGMIVDNIGRIASGQTQKPH
jgi:Hemerythrin HHE cation binding domain